MDVAAVVNLDNASSDLTSPFRRFKSAYMFFSTIKHKEIREELGSRGVAEKVSFEMSYQDSFVQKESHLCSLTCSIVRLQTSQSWCQ